MTTRERMPYPGLRAFTRDESDLFFGRDGCVDAMVDRLAATRFLAVLGASGSGKSSLVRTGLLDALDLGLHRWAGTRWRIADLHPGGQPIRGLAAALLAAKGEAADATSVDLLAAFLRRGPRSVAEWAAGGNLEPGTNLLILVDQFEELFRYGSYARQEEAEAFVSLLLETAALPGINLHVVLTMRSEFLGACALMPGLAERINAGLYLTPRMTREECQEAIEGPAAVIGFTVERPLVNRLLNDLASFAPWDAGDAAGQADRLARRADQLPLMQHVLNRLWTRTRAAAGGAEVVLRLSDYDGLGGLAGALDAQGNEVLAALGDAWAPVAESMFRSLVSGSTVADAVRRPCTLRELVAVTGNREATVEVLEAFRAADCNFVRTSDPASTADEVIVDVSHESLIRQWTPLRQWLANEARDGATWRRLAAAEERYGNGEGGLLTGLDLRGAAAWWEAAEPTPAWAERHGGRFQAVQRFQENSRRDEAAQAQAERRRQLRERNRLRVGMAVLASALVVAVVSFLQVRRSGLKLAEKNQMIVRAEQQAQEQLKAATIATQEAKAAKATAETDKARAEAAAAAAKAATQRAETNAAAATAATVRAEAATAQLRLEETFSKSVLTTVHLPDFDKIPGIDNLRSAVDRNSRSPRQNDAREAQASNPVHDGSPQAVVEGDGTKEVAAARAKFALEATAENLQALKTASDQLYDAHVKKGRQSAADDLHKELVDAAELLVAKTPTAAAYRLAWDILTDHGDRMVARNRSAARQAFARGVELAERLPAADLYNRIVSYERIGDQDLADGNIVSAGQWYEKEVALNRKRYAPAATASNLQSLKISIDRLYDVQIRLGKQAEAGTLQTGIAEEADRLVAKDPGVESYRVAADIFFKKGDHLKWIDRPAARTAYLRSADLAEALPHEADDLYRRAIGYERVGDLDAAGDRTASALDWYQKEVQAARQIYTLDHTVGKLGTLKIAIDRLYETQVKLKRQGEADERLRELASYAGKLYAETRERYDTGPTAAALESLRIASTYFRDAQAKLKQQAQAGGLRESLVAAADALLKGSPSAEALREAGLAYIESADQLFDAGDARGARRDQATALKLAKRLGSDTPDGAWTGYILLNAVGSSLTRQNAAAEAHEAYVDAAITLDHYLVGFRTASPSRRAADESQPVPSLYGNLSFAFLLAGNFQRAMQAGARGLEGEPGAAWIEANLAHALLLSGKQSEAVQRYMHARTGTLNERSIVDATREDFDILKRLGMGHPEMDRILEQMAQN